MVQFPQPQHGASLLLAFRPVKKNVLIIGGNSLAASRAFAALEAEANVLVLVNGGLKESCEELRWRAEQQQISLFDLDTLPTASAGPSDYWRDAQAVDSFIFTLPDKVHLVCITDTIVAPHGYRRGRDSAAHIARHCRHRSIPTNVADMPDLCDFTFMTTQRFADQETGKSSPLQVGVTTNGHGCRLAGRVRRDVVASLPKEIGVAVRKVGQLRGLVKASDKEAGEDQELNEDSAPVTPNEPVPQRKPGETAAERARRRMKWVAQVSEYWPIRRLAHMSEEDMASILDERNELHSPTLPANDSASQETVITPVHDLTLSQPRRGRIFLVGSGPGHPSLLTVATHAALTKHAHLVLSDKLVPAAVLALIPSGVEVRIARKFPGNADGAQNELMEAAVEAARRGLTVVRVSVTPPILTFWYLYLWGSSNKATLPSTDVLEKKSFTSVRTDLSPSSFLALALSSQVRRSQASRSPNAAPLNPSSYALVSDAKGKK